METAPTKQPLVYVLELIGDPVNSGGTIIIEIGGASLSEETLTALKLVKEKKLREYFGEEEPEDNEEEDEDDEEDEDEDFGDDFTYRNSDYSTRPYWTVTAYPLL